MNILLKKGADFISLSTDFDKACDTLASICFDIERLEKQIERGFTSEKQIEIFQKIDKRIEKAYGKLTDIRKELAHRMSAVGTLPPFYSFCSQKEDTEIKMLDNYIRIKLDGLLPIPTVGARNIIHAGIRDEINKLRQKTNDDIRLTEKCYIFFIHHYPMGKKERTYRDFDNLDKRVVMNALVQYLIPDDSPGAIIMTADLSQKDTQKFTEIYIVPASKIKYFLNAKSVF